MSEAKHTPGPLTVSVNNKWPFKIVTKNADGEVVFATDLPCYSTSHECAADAIDGVGLPAEWNAAEMNARAIADEVLRSAAPDLLDALDSCIGTLEICFPEAPVDSVIGKDIATARAAIAQATKAQT